ncbi:hypothetical protein [Micromonospora auratinigra]|uniref:Uncharacterized protein n=1 Tax=Micromonospora auratinigra TaxID=261654 RepID=A0A1A8ZE14_9ACTN|nr:hypothetical protein [Micromonospora auratinigra]SBT42068.1 hypothetical protein GA0070611_1848 [Micromonospora auratinigra]
MDVATDPAEGGNETDGWFDSWFGTLFLAGLNLVAAAACHAVGWWDAARTAYTAVPTILLLRLAVLVGRSVQRRRRLQRAGSRRVFVGWLVAALLAFAAMFPALAYTGDDGWGVLAVLALFLLFLGCLVPMVFEARRITRDRSAAG